MALCSLPSDVWEYIFKYVDYSTDIILVCKTLNDTIVKADFYTDYTNLLMKKIIYTQKHKISELKGNVELLEGELEHHLECTIEEFYHQDKYGVELCICTEEYGGLYSDDEGYICCPDCDNEVKKCDECYKYRNIDLINNSSNGRVICYTCKIE